MNADFNPPENRLDVLDQCGIMQYLKSEIAAAACARTNNESADDVSLERNPKRTKRDNTNTNKRTLADHDDG